MDFGIALTFSNPGSKFPLRHFVDSQIDQAVLAEELGYDHVWMAQHHGTDMYFPTPFPILAAVAARTRRIRLGTYIVILPIQHPLDVAEQAVTLDMLSGGRFDLGLGLGNFILDFEAYGISRHERGSRMEESLAIIRGLWTQEKFSFQGKHYSLPPFTLNPRPIQASPPLWVAATAEKAFDRAARYQCHLAGGSGLGIEYYESRLRAYGHDPKDYYKSVLQLIHVAETREQAWKEAAPSVLAWLRYYKNRMDETGDLKNLGEQPGGYFGVDPLPHPDDLESMQRLTFFGSPLLIGGPEDAIERIEQWKQRGFTHIVLGMQSAIEPELAEKSIRLFAKHVLPVFQKAQARSSG